jgi:hypothetical protein
MYQNNMVEDSKALLEVEDSKALLKDDISSSHNSLADLINWSKNGYVIALNGGRYCKCYCRQEYFSSNKMIQINFSNQWRCLMEEDEWPWYLLDSGCIRMTREDFLKLNIVDTKVFSL